MSSGTPMVIKIFKVIFEEALRRPGSNIRLNLHTVMVELIAMIRECIGYIQEQESEEVKRGDDDG